MTNENETQETKKPAKRQTKNEVLPIKLLNKTQASISAEAASTNVWKDAKIDLNKVIDKDEYDLTVDLCRFFYKTEPLVSTVINKLVEIGVNDIIISKKGLSDNEFRLFEAIKPRLLEFSETMAQELLLSGLVVPEIGYGPLDKDELMEMGVKKYERLVAPVSMWVRDPKSIKIYSSIMSDSPSYYVIIPDDVIFFIKNKGKYQSGNEDKVLFDELKTFYPDFVKKIMGGEKEFLLDNKLIIRRKYLTENPYPIPYIASSLDPLQHKRRMRRMDYSIMDKVISAIMHITVGDKDFPVTNTEEDQEVFTDLRAQLQFRFQSDERLERIFQLITNHTIGINWIFPDTTLLANSDRYEDINQEILFGLGFPRVLITGETAKSGTSDPEIAILSPVKTMESVRRKLLKIVRDIIKTVAQENNFNVPSVSFKVLNLHSFKDFMENLEKAYNMSAVSRTSVADYMGYDMTEEVDKLEAESALLKEKGLPEFGQTAFSKSPDNNSSAPNSTDTSKDRSTKTAKKPAVKE